MSQTDRTVARAPRGDDAYQQRVTSHDDAQIILATGAEDDYLHAYCDAAGINLDAVMQKSSPGHALRFLRAEFYNKESPLSGEVGYDILPERDLSRGAIRAALDDSADRAESGCDLEYKTMRDDLQEAFDAGTVGEKLIGDYYWYAVNSGTGDCDDTDFAAGGLYQDAKVRDYYGQDVYAGWPVGEDVSEGVYIIAQFLEPVSEDGVLGKLLGYVDSATVAAQPVVSASEKEYLETDSRVIWWDELYAPVPRTIAAALHADYAFL